MYCIQLNYKFKAANEAGWQIIGYGKPSEATALLVGYDKTFRVLRNKIYHIAQKLN